MILTPTERRGIRTQIKSLQSKNQYRKNQLVDTEIEIRNLRSKLKENEGNG